MTGDRQNEPTAPVHPGGERWIVDGGDGCTTEFDTEAEAVAYADACIQDWCDEGWMEEVDNIFVARLTHRSQRQVVAVQGEVSDEEWERVTHGGSGYSEWWEYTIEPVGSTPQAPTVDSVPATPSPVPDSERPATNLLRHLADDVGDHIGDDDRTRILAAADWIDAQPAADQGPDLSEAAALLEEYDQSVHNLTRFGTVEAQTDHLLASERVAAFARRLLDREGGN